MMPNNLPNCPKCDSKAQEVTMVKCPNADCELFPFSYWPWEWIAMVEASDSDLNTLRDAQNIFIKSK
jgi:hypothetical protein